MANDVSPLAIVHQAYRRLNHDELVVFLLVRNLPITGTDSDLASRLAQHDFHTYHFPTTTNGSDSKHTPKSRQTMAPDLPIEIIAEIMELLGDWELTKAVGIPTSLSRPSEWDRASATDHAMISGYLPLIRSSDPSAHPPTSIGAILAIRFGYVHVLEFFFSQHRVTFDCVFKEDVIPIKASRHGRTTVLSWWKQKQKQSMPIIPPSPHSIADAIEGASRNGQVASLDWWLDSDFRLEYSEAALDYASAKNQIAVLEWWKTQNKTRGLPLKIGRVMEMASKSGHVKTLEWWAASQLEFKYDRHALIHASCHGKIDVLRWWIGSGLQLIFDQDALTGATRHNRPEVLEWWDTSGLPIQYRVCDIEEALEDAIGGGEAARVWWRKKGVDFNANDNEWMKLQNLN